MTSLTLNEQQQESSASGSLDQPLQATAPPPPSAKEKERERVMSQFKARKSAEDFAQRLVDFHRHRSINAPLYQLPTLNGKPLDLQALYTAVVRLGGWERVCEKDLWDEVGSTLDPSLFPSCTNAAHGLKVIYVRYLSLYEKFDSQVNLTDSLAANSNATITSLLDTHSSSNPSILHTIMSYPSSMMTSATINPSLLNSTIGLIRDSGASSMSSMHRIQSTSVLLDDKFGTDPEIHRRKFSYLIETAPMTYNYNQHLAEVFF